MATTCGGGGGGGGSSLSTRALEAHASAARGAAAAAASMMSGGDNSDDISQSSKPLTHNVTHDVIHLTVPPAMDDGRLGKVLYDLIGPEAVPGSRFSRKFCLRQIRCGNRVTVNALAKKSPGWKLFAGDTLTFDTRPAEPQPKRKKTTVEFAIDSADGNLKYIIGAITLKREKMKDKNERLRIKGIAKNMGHLMKRLPRILEGCVKFDALMVKNHSRGDQKPEGWKFKQQDRAKGIISSLEGLRCFPQDDLSEWKARLNDPTFLETITRSRNQLRRLHRKIKKTIFREYNRRNDTGVEDTCRQLLVVYEGMGG